ncbi:MAG: DNA-(apurinic or apyrimidinic site) lyase [Parcubacteria group bacterium Gr01-1014_8]|nr:MAG: DNA-(apurinic or apyrimidinic site) lyase [Parcubacteria group bacterium Gr01-1014_8]
MIPTAKRRKRAEEIVRYLKKKYPEPKSELQYKTPFQFVVAVILSAQCTDKLVNKVTEELFRKYKDAKAFAKADAKVLEREVSRVSFFRNKSKAIIQAAKIVAQQYKGKVPSDAAMLQKLPGVGYKTAHVVLGELYDVWPGIATDTHVKRFARKFDLTGHTDLTKISKDLEKLVPRKDWKYMNNGLVLYGRYICKARRHDCAGHPLTKLWPKAARIWPKT